MRIFRPRRTRRLISLTPLIDVVFILLVFFMLASSSLDWRAFTLELAAAAAGAARPQETILVRINADGGLKIDGESLSLDDLDARLLARRADEPQSRLLVQPDLTVSMQRIVSVLDRLTEAGVEGISLVFPVAAAVR